MSVSGGPAARDIADVCRMGVATQANVVQLRVEEKRRGSRDGAAGDIEVPSPGAVKTYREVLIDSRVIRSYSDVELRLRSHEIWGRFCLLCWALHGDSERPPVFSECPQTTDLKCPSSTAIKTAEVEGLLWRMQYEQRMRHDPSFRDEPSFELDRAMADRIPAMVFDEPVGVCDDNALLVCACEYAGMLASLRWMADAQLAWDHPGIMDASRPDLVD
jgi:hypothetical protein